MIRWILRKKYGVFFKFIYIVKCFYDILSKYNLFCWIVDFKVQFGDMLSSFTVYFIVKALRKKAALMPSLLKI